MAITMLAACTNEPTSVVQPPGDAGGDGDGTPVDTQGGWVGGEAPQALGGAPLLTASGLPWESLTFTVADVEVSTTLNAVGLQGKLLRAADGTLYHVYLKYIGSRTVDPDLNRNCDIAVFGGGPAPASQYDIHMAIRPPGSPTWNIETVPLNNVPAQDNRPFVGGPLGLDAVLSSTGGPIVAFAGGGPGLFTCASSDLVVATRQPWPSCVNTGCSGSWTSQVPVTGSAAFSNYCNSTCTTCTGGCACNAPACCNDPNCGAGEDVGMWAAIDRAASGVIAVAFTDAHNYVDNDGYQKRGLELWESSGSVTGIRPWSGWGRIAALRFAGTTPVVAFTGYPRTGLQVARRAYLNGDGNDWPSEQLRSGTIGERIVMEVAPSGRLGLVFHLTHDQTGRVANDLFYCYSDDGGGTWSPFCESIDLVTLHVGGTPSLAFDSDSRPVVSYYLCGGDATCRQQEDGLRLAFRDDMNHWRIYNVHNEAANRSGLYSQIAIDPVTDVPTLVFHHMSTGSAKVAQGAFN